MNITKFKCIHCGAPIDVNPEDAIFNCPSCGQAFAADGTEFKNHYFLPNNINKNQVYSIIAAFIKKKGFLRGIKNYSITDIKPMLMPFWVVRTHAFTHFIGYERYTETRTYTVGTGKNRRTVTEHVTVYRPIEKDIDEERIDTFLARRATTIYGYKKVKRIVQREFNKAIAFDKKLLLDDENEFEYLSAEFSDIRANQLTKTIIFDEHRARAEKVCTKVFDCATQITFLGTYFVHVPVWEIQYTFKEETYRVAINGSTGEIIKGEIPITTRYRATFFFLSFLILALGGALSWIFGIEHKILPFIFGAIFGLFGWSSLEKALKPISVVE
ncbi:MAG: hypothetical protein ACTSQE_11270 [Candidatus Heimdallarchaeaceae archaeon]